MTVKQYHIIFIYIYIYTHYYLLYWKVDTLVCVCFSLPLFVLCVQDLLQLQYEGVAVMKMFDKAKVNVNLLIFLLNKKFYGKWENKEQKQWGGGNRRGGGNRLCLLTVQSLLKKINLARKHQMVKDCFFFHLIIIWWIIPKLKVIVQLNVCLLYFSTWWL